METQEHLPRRKQSKSKVILLPLIAIGFLLIIAISFSAWIILGGSQFYYMKWGNPDGLTFYSQMPFLDGSDEYEWGETINIDGGFNDSIYQGSYEYSKYKNEDLGIKSQISVADSPDWSFTDNAYIGDGGVDQAYESGATTIITGGFNLSAAYETLYTQEGFSDQSFYDNGWQVVMLDDSTLGLSHPSAISISFDGADAGFLAGIAASVYTTQQIIEGKTTSDDIVVWGGMAFDTVYSLMSGFEQGINYFNYKVLGVDVMDGTHDKAAGETLGLVNELSLGSTELVNGLDITNGFDLETDYTDPSTIVDNEATINAPELNEVSWYTGGFESDPEPVGGYSPGYGAKQRTENSISNGVSVMFPVAGGQYITAADVLRTSAETHNSKVIAVDVDGTMANPENAEYYLGSAIKNIKDATSLGTWFADGKQGNPEFNGISGEDFTTINTESNGWAVDTNGNGTIEHEIIMSPEELETNTYDAHAFKGTYLNGGVDFTEGIEENGTTAINAAYISLVDELGLTGTAPATFNEFATLAYQDNIDSVGMIENASNTFGAYGSSPITESGIALWIPDWNTYQ